jgi:hypothetical protein
MRAQSSKHYAACQGNPCGYLAVGVINRAVRDLTGDGGSRADQESARAFLAGSPMFFHWCAVANLNPTWMVARTKKLLAAGGAFNVRGVTQRTDSATQSATFHARGEENGATSLGHVAHSAGRLVLEGDETTLSQPSARLRRRHPESPAFAAPLQRGCRPDSD